VQFKDNYPKEAPSVVCTTPIYHPNIDVAGGDENVCVSLLNEWTETCTLEDMVQALLFLIHNPNADDPLSQLTQGLTHEEFEDKARAIYENNDNPFSTAEYDVVDEEYLDAEVRAEDYFQAAFGELKETKREEWERTATERNAEWSKALEEEAFAEKIKKWELDEKIRLEEEKRRQEEAERRQKEEEEKRQKEEDERRRLEENRRRMEEEKAREAENDTNNAGLTSAENPADRKASSAAPDCSQGLDAALPVDHPEVQVFNLIQRLYQAFLAKARVLLACGGAQNIAAQDASARPQESYLAGETNASREPCNLEVTEPESCRHQTDSDKFGDSRRRRVSFVQEDSAGRPPYNRCVSC
jgi:hypothetical protein